MTGAYIPKSQLVAEEAKRTAIEILSGFKYPANAPSQSRLAAADVRTFSKRAVTHACHLLSDWPVDESLKQLDKMKRRRLGAIKRIEYVDLSDHAELKRESDNAVRVQSAVYLYKLSMPGLLHMAFQRSRPETKALAKPVIDALQLFTAEAAMLVARPTEISADGGKIYDSPPAIAAKANQIVACHPSLN